MGKLHLGKEKNVLNGQINKAINVWLKNLGFAWLPSYFIDKMYSI